MREWNLVSASLQKQAVSSRLGDWEDPMAYGDRGILSLWSISRCSMSAAVGVSRRFGFSRERERERGDEQED